MAIGLAGCDELWDPLGDSTGASGLSIPAWEDSEGGLGVTAEGPSL